MKNRLSSTLFVLLFLSAVNFALAELPRPMKVGVIQSLSGIAAEDGKTVVQALQLATEDLNKGNALRVQLLVEDDQSVPKNGVTASARNHGG